LGEQGGERQTLGHRWPRHWLLHTQPGEAHAVAGHGKPILTTSQLRTV
jgi:hypothetical protein